MNHRAIVLSAVCLFVGAFAGGAVGSMFGVTSTSGVTGAMIGGVLGVVAGLVGGIAGRLSRRRLSSLRNSSSPGEGVADRDGASGRSTSGLLASRVLDALKDGQWVPIALFVTMCCLMAYVRGVHYGGDTSRYIEGAERILAGEPLALRQNTYVGYILYVAALKGLGLGDLGIIVGQVVLSGLVTVALYDLGRRLSGPAAGVVAASLYAANPDIARFTFAILTDSLYTSSLVLMIYAFYQVQASGWTKWVTVASVTGFATAIIRPNGWTVLPLYLFLLAFGLISRRGIQQAIRPIGMMVCATAVLLVLVFSTGLTEGNPLQIVLDDGWAERAHPASGMVIAGDPDLLARTPSSTIRMPAVAGEGTETIFTYCINQVGACSRLFATRVWTLFAHTRSFYSFRHNLLILVTVPVIYFLASIGFIAHWRDPLSWLVLAIISVHAALVGYSFADWDGRFLTYFFPLITLYSAIGFIGLLTLMRR